MRKTLLTVKPYKIIMAFLIPLIFSGLQPCMAANSLLAEQRNDLLQFTAGKHILGFRHGEMYIAAFDHSLNITFMGAHDVKPEESVFTVATTAISRQAKPLGVVKYENLWDNITLVYERTADGAVKSTYYIAPAAGISDAKTYADVGHIRLRYNVPVSLDSSGNLRLAFETGLMKESAPVAWQDIDGQRIPVEVSFRIVEEREVGFSVGEYNPLFPLIIDPVLSWSTFMGGGGSDGGKGIAVDGSGNVYVTGYSSATWGAPIVGHSGNDDAFAAKLIPSLPPLPPGIGIPTLNEWGMILAFLLLAGAGVKLMRNTQVGSIT